MGAGHGHHRGTGSRGLGVAFLLNLGFTIFEIVGGLLTNSVAILSDAVHDAGDSLSLGIAWFLQRIAQRESDTNFTYGYARFSVLGALITSALLVGGLLFVVTRAVPRLWNPEEVHGGGMLAIAVIGIVVNGIAAMRLKSGTSLNERLASWHLLEDVLGWVAVLAGGIVVLIWDFRIIDPILSLLISGIVLWNVFKNFGTVIAVFLQKVPRGFDTAKFIAETKRIPSVANVHNTHAWTIDGEHHVLTTHVALEKAVPRERIVKIKEQIRSLLRDYPFEHVTIDVELPGEPCISCAQKPPSATVEQHAD